jgi:hypothetical protein
VMLIKLKKKKKKKKEKKPPLSINLVSACVWFIFIVGTVGHCWGGPKVPTARGEIQKRNFISLIYFSF